MKHPIYCYNICYLLYIPLSFLVPKDIYTYIDLRVLLSLSLSPSLSTAPLFDFSIFHSYSHAFISPLSQHSPSHLRFISLYHVTSTSPFFNNIFTVFPSFPPPLGSPSLSTLSLIHNAFTTLVSRYPSTILNLFSLCARRFPHRRVPTLIQTFNYLHAPSSTNAYSFVAELYRFTCVQWLAGVSWY